jgi:hypothetical protein
LKQKNENANGLHFKQGWFSCSWRAYEDFFFILQIRRFWQMQKSSSVLPTYIDYLFWTKHAGNVFQSHIPFHVQRVLNFHILTSFLKDLKCPVPTRVFCLVNDYGLVCPYNTWLVLPSQVAVLFGVTRLVQFSPIGPYQNLFN